MRVYVAAKAGFCFGVKRAIDLAIQSARNRDGPLYSLGPLIHNPQVVNALSREGIKEIKSVEEAEPGGTLVIRSHGVSPETFDRAEQLNMEIVDATCPFVSKAQKTARKLKDYGYEVIIVGEKDHPEVKGLVGWAEGEAIVIKDTWEALELSGCPCMGVIAQTTQSRENYREVIEILKEKCEQIQVWDTICNATRERQDAAMDLAGRVDVMVVVGGYNSANTKKLAVLCRASGTPTYHVETAGQLKKTWFEGIGTAGITAGASTPDWIIEEVYSYMKSIDEMNYNEENENEEEVTVPEENGEEQTQQDMEEAMQVKSLRPGEIVKGTVVQVNNDEVLVDIGAKSEGAIPLKEISCYNINSPSEVVNTGDEIDVLVLKAEDSDGRVLLSKERADAEKAWSFLEERLESGEPVRGPVREVVKGGLLIDLGLRAFLPASLVEEGYVEDLQQYVGQDIDARVIELNKPRKKVILSRKSVLEEERGKKRQEVLENLQEGEVVKGTVRRLTSFGAFVDIGGIDGLLHISEMAWYRIDHPSDIVSEGDEINVKVLRVDKESEKISLGLKQIVANPWDDVENKYPPESIVDAKVVRLAPFGAFVQLEPGVEGLIHISHLADHHVEEPGEIVSEGEELKVKVLNVNPEEKRIRLSLREAQAKKAPEKKEPEAKPKKVAPVEEESAGEQNDEGESGNVTIGEMVGDIFKNRE